MVKGLNIFARLSSVLPALPEIGRSIDLPVYLIHNSADAEDYFFIFDFEQLVEKSRKGLFVRPKLKVWAGRDDFARDRFARQFRESFAREFDLARSALAHSHESSGWFSWGTLKDAISTSGASFVADVILLVSLSAGKLIWEALPVPAVFRGRSKEAQLEGAIQATQNKVDEALTKMEVIMHKQLTDHAWERGGAFSTSKLNHDAWPLPKQIADHLKDGKSSSFW